MERRTLALTILGAGSWLAWYPVIAARGLVPWWAALPLLALLTATTTLLFPKERFGIVTTVSLCTLLGDYSGYLLWLPRDGVSVSFVPLVVAGTTIAALLVAFLTALLAYRFAPSDDTLRRGLWGVLFACLAIEAIAASGTPMAMRYRAARNDRVAAARFLALKQAVEKTVAEGQPVCEGATLERHYSGPGFSDMDWNQLINNAVREKGFSFAILCQEDRYVIEVAPVRDRIDGTRRFCTDESRNIGCGWNRLSRVIGAFPVRRLNCSSALQDRRDCERGRWRFVVSHSGA